MNGAISPSKHLSATTDCELPRASPKSRHSLDATHEPILKSLRAIGKPSIMDTEQVKEREAHLEGTVQQLQESLVALSTKYGSLLQDFEAQATQLHSCEVENAQLREEVAGLAREQRALAKTQFESALKYENEMKDADAKSGKWKAREQALLEQIKGLKADMKGFKSNEKKREKERRDSMDQEAAGSQLLVDELRDTNRKSESTIVSLNEQIKKLQTDYELLLSKLCCESEVAAHLKLQNHQLETDFRDLAEDRDALLQEVNHFELLLKEKVQVAFDIDVPGTVSAMDGDKHVAVETKEQASSPIKPVKRDSYFLGLVNGNSLAGELRGELEEFKRLSNEMRGHETEKPQEEDVVAENAALKDEILALTMYINKLIQKIDSVSDVPEPPSFGLAFRRKLMTSIRKISGSSEVSTKLVYDHKEWTAKEESESRRASVAPLSKCPSNDSDMSHFSDVTLHLDGKRDSDKFAPCQDQKSGYLSSLKKWILPSFPPTASQQPALEVPLAHARLREAEITRSILLDELLKKVREEGDAMATVKEVQKLERAFPKMGYRQSRILENKRSNGGGVL
ncbi:hypothetical protein BC830DRAFT_1150539, partial [Chytriomyces sp. MP71]